MSADQSTSEFTTRDVLTQVDRRVSLIERDVRELREHLDDRFDAAGRQTSQQFAELRRELDRLRTQAGTNMRWIIGLVLASWLSLMGTNLLR